MPSWPDTHAKNNTIALKGIWNARCWVQIGDMNLTGAKIDRRSGSDRWSLSLSLPDLNLTIFPLIPCLVSGRRSEPIIIHLKLLKHCSNVCYSFQFIVVVFVLSGFVSSWKLSIQYTNAFLVLDSFLLCSTSKANKLPKCIAFTHRGL